MILQAGEVGDHLAGLPRECGGDPYYGIYHVNYDEAFPANAGMIPGSSTPRSSLSGLPRECGGDPPVFEYDEGGNLPSPHPRG